MGPPAGRGGSWSTATWACARTVDPEAYPAGLPQLIFRLAVSWPTLVGGSLSRPPSASVEYEHRGAGVGPGDAAAAAHAEAAEAERGAVAGGGRGRGRGGGGQRGRGVRAFPSPKAGPPRPAGGGGGDEHRFRLRLLRRPSPGPVWPRGSAPAPRGVRSALPAACQIDSALGPAGPGAKPRRWQDRSLAPISGFKFQSAPHSTGACGLLVSESRGRAMRPGPQSTVTVLQLRKGPGGRLHLKKSDSNKNVIICLVLGKCYIERVNVRSDTMLCMYVGHRRTVWDRVLWPRGVFTPQRFTRTPC